MTDVAKIETGPGDLSPGPLLFHLNRNSSGCCLNDP